MTIKGGTNTKGGLYWKKGEWEIVTVEGKRGTLPGAEDAAYLRIPTILFVPVAMLLGMLYVIFLPFIGFAMLLRLIARKIASRFRALSGVNHSKPETSA